MRLVMAQGLPLLQVLRQLEASPRGLAEDDAQERLAAAGDNLPVGDPPPGWAAQLARAGRDPFVLLLLGLVAVSVGVGSGDSAAVISVLVILSVLIRLRQERRGGRAAAALNDLVAVTATVVRRASPAAGPAEREVPVDQIVPGDIVRLAPGDMVPADLRLLRSAGLAVSQALLTGESLPVAKEADGRWDGTAPLDCPWLCLAGSSVAGGSGTGVVVATGHRTYLAAGQPGPGQPGPGQPGPGQPGSGARRPETSFESGMKRVSWTLIRFMAISLGLVLAVTGVAGGPRAGTVLFLVSIAVGLTPEMMPVVITTALTRGARAMARRGVIVKRLPAIHNLGAMDLLCTDKTGTLTGGHPDLDFTVDPDGQPGPGALRLATLNSYWCVEGPGGPVCSPLDEALLKHAAGAGLLTGDDVSAVAVAPFDPAVRCATVVLRPSPLRPPACPAAIWSSPRARPPTCSAAAARSSPAPAPGPSARASGPA